jgi:hypothetical protein
MGRAKGCAEIHFGMGCEQKRGDRNKFRSTGRRGVGAAMGERKGAPKFISAWVVSRSGVTEINFGQRAGVGCGRKWGERKGAPKFISAWVVSRSGVTEINFGQRAGAGRGRTRGAAGCAEIHFGMGWGRTWGDRNEFRSTGRRGVGAAMGERKGAPKFISAWVVSRSGVTEINFGQRAGVGCGRKWGAAGCAEIRFGMGWGGHGATERVRRNSFRHGLGEDKGRAKGCAEIHFGMGCEQKRGDRNKFRSTGRRGAGADAGRGRVRRNLFRHGL